ncbi:TetR/AcrR family transcriptional regulator [Cytobacillus sp. Hm23]
MSPRTGLDLQTILQTAAEIANEQGLEAVTLAVLAKKLNIRPPSLYNHIDGLPGLRKQLAIYGLEKLHNELTSAVIGIAGEDAVHSLAKAYVNFARSNCGLYEATLMAPDASDEAAQKASRNIVNLVLAVLQTFRLEDEAALHTVRGLRSILHGFSSLEQHAGFGLNLSLDDSLHYIVSTYLNGISKMQK